MEFTYPHIAASILHVSIGVFFAISGYHKLTNTDRRAMLHATLSVDLPRLGLPLSIIPFMCIWVPSWELFAGTIAAASPLLYLYDVPIIAKLAMLPMIGILAIALICEGKERVRSYQPIDLADAIDDALYLPETLLFIMAVTALFL